MDGPLRLIYDLLGGPSKHDGARLAQGHATEPDHALFSDDNLKKRNSHE